MVQLEEGLDLIVALTITPRILLANEIVGNDCMCMASIDIDVGFGYLKLLFSVC